MPNVSEWPKNVKKQPESTHPRYSSEAAQIWYSNHVTVAVLRIGNLELLEVVFVMHVPCKDDGAEPKPIFSYRKEFLLGHELAPQCAINIDASNLDFVIIFEDLG